MIPTARRRHPALLVLLCLVALAGRGARAAPVLHGTLEIESHGLLAWPMGLCSLVLTGMAVPMWWVKVTRGVKVPNVGASQGIHVENDYHATVRFTLVPGGGGYHLASATIDYAMRDFSYIVPDGGTSMKDHMWARGRIRWAHGHWIGAPPGWKVRAGPRLNLRFDRTGHFHLDGEILHPVRPGGASRWTSPMGALVLTGKGDHMVLETKLPFDASKVPANAGPFGKLMKQAGGMAMRPIRIDAPEPMSMPIHMTGDAIGESVRAVRTLPMPASGQMVTWLTVGP